MADRKSAILFGRIFNLLAENPGKHNKWLASEIYSLKDDFDFSESQMRCDTSLIALGLAKMTIHPCYPGGYEAKVEKEVFYKGDDEFDIIN